MKSPETVRREIARRAMNRKRRLERKRKNRSRRKVAKENAAAKARGLRARDGAAMTTSAEELIADGEKPEVRDAVNHNPHWTRDEKLIEIEFEGQPSGELFAWLAGYFLLILALLAWGVTEVCSRG